MQNWQNMDSSILASSLQVSLFFIMTNDYSYNFSAGLTDTRTTSYVHVVKAEKSVVMMVNEEISHFVVGICDLK